MIYGIIKVEVSVRLWLITLTETLIIPDITITESNIVLLYKQFLFFYYRSHSYFAVRELDIAVRALDIALGNHALRTQPTDYSLICRYRLVNNL